MRTRHLHLLLTAFITLTACTVSAPAPSTSDPGDTTSDPGATTPDPGETQSYVYAAPTGPWDGKAQTGPWCQPTASSAALQASSASVPAQLDLTTTARGVATDWTGRVPGKLRVYTGATDGAPNADQLRALGLRTLSTDGHGWALLEGNDDALRSTADALVARGIVQYAQPEYRYAPAGLPNPPSDTSYPLKQEKLLGLSNIAGGWEILEAGCQPVIVAVIDSGVPFAGGWDDTELQPNFVPRSAWFNVSTKSKGDAEPPASLLDGVYWHGTAVAGVIGMVAHNGASGAGVAYNQAKILPINAMKRYEDGTYGFDSGSIGTAIAYALGSTTIDGLLFTNPYPARVLNVSLGADGSKGGDAYLESYFEAAANTGAVTLVASGNENTTPTSSLAQNTWTIGVGATKSDGTRAVWSTDPLRPSGSNYDKGLDFMAIGTNVLSRTKGAERSWTGTSFATPVMAGQVSLWMYANQHHKGHITNGKTGTAVFNAAMTCLAAASQHTPDWAWDGVKYDWVAGTGWQSETGAGLVDTSKLVDPNFAACR